MYPDDKDTFDFSQYDEGNPYPLPDVSEDGDTEENADRDGFPIDDMPEETPVEEPFGDTVEEPIEEPVQEEPPKEEPKKKKKERNQTPPPPPKKKIKKAPVNLKKKTESEKLNRYLSVVFYVLAGILLLILVLDLISNPQGTQAPKDHMLGEFGYYTGVLFYGLLGYSALALPIILFLLGQQWHTMEKRKKSIARIVFCCLLPLLIAGIFGAIYLQGYVNDNGCTPEIAYRQLHFFDLGAKKIGGGWFGGMLSYALISGLNFVGCYLLLGVAIPLCLFLFYWTTPGKLWTEIRFHKALKEEGPTSVSEALAKEAETRAKVDEKLRRISVRDAILEEEPDRLDGKTQSKLAPGAPKGAIQGLLPSRVRENDDYLPNLSPYSDDDKLHLPKLPNEKSEAEAKEENKDASAEAVFPVGDKQKVIKIYRKNKQKTRETFSLDSVFGSTAPAPAKEKPTAKTQENAPTSQGNAEKPIAIPVPKQNKNAAMAGAPAKDLEIKETDDQDADFDEAIREIERQKEEDNAMGISALEGGIMTNKNVKEKKYIFPSLDLLHEPEPESADSLQEAEQKAKLISEVMQSIDAPLESITYLKGPTVTRFDMIPTIGVRAAKVDHALRDLQMRLGSNAIQMYQIPDDPGIALEVPNKQKNIVYLRETLEDDQFRNAKNPLTFGVGKNVAGQPVFSSIVKMPHLLIAGQTMSGKSVCMNAIIISMVYKMSPDDLKMILIDPKKVEFNIFADIPHLLCPIVNSPELAVGALQLAVTEMGNRYSILESYHVRNIKEYNKRTANDSDAPAMPYILICADELAELILTDYGKQIELLLIRLLQLGRAAGIHVIGGTQRPSRNVVTGLLKANFTSKIAFTVASHVDSQVILDINGAEDLLGAGDCLYYPTGAMRPIRVQGSFVETEEVEAVCKNIIEKNGKAVYDESLLEMMNEIANKAKSNNKNSDMDLSDSEDEGPTKYKDMTEDEALLLSIRILFAANRTSASYVQTETHFGFNKATRMVTKMEKLHILSPLGASGKRNFMLTEGEFEEKLLNGEYPNLIEAAKNPLTRPGNVAL